MLAGQRDTPAAYLRLLGIHAEAPSNAPGLSSNASTEEIFAAAVNQQEQQENKQEDDDWVL